jgi:hypothetical protein
MVDSLCIEACCRFNERFPRFRRLWLLLWHIAIRSAIASTNRRFRLLRP